MKKKALFLAFMFFFTLPAYSKITRIDCNLNIKDQEAIASISINLYSETPINYFSIEMPFQGNRIIKISDSIGNIKNYEVRDGKLFVKTNSSAKRKEELLKIEAQYKELEKEAFLQARILDFSVAAEDNTELYFRAHGPIHGFDASPGFKGSVKGGELFLVGYGPLHVRFIYSHSGQRFGRFIVFEDGSISNAHLTEIFNEAENLYFILPNVLGIEPDQDIYAIAILCDSNYNSRVNNYSRGIYVNGGLILLKESVLREKKSALPVILHELAHCFNAKAFAWNSSKAVWLDEGLAKFIEYLVSKNLGIKVPNLFLGEKKYIEGRYVYTIFPSGDFNDLYQYYNDESSYMAEWNAENSEKRTFGYAFSELFVRDYIFRNGFEKLHYAMQSFLNEKENIYDSREFTKKALEKLETSLEPCKATKKEMMVSCINELNSFAPEIPKAKIVVAGPKQLQKTDDFDIFVVRAKNIKAKFRDLNDKMQKFLEFAFKATEAHLQ